MITEPITITTHAQLNALVAEKVMGLELYGDGRAIESYLACMPGGGHWHSIPNYSTDMNAAVEVARKVDAGISFREEKATVTVSASSWRIWRIRHQSPAIAICLAALRCEGVEVVLKLGGEG